MKFLDSTGLGVLWNKIKSSFLSLNGGGLVKCIYNYPNLQIGNPSGAPYLSANSGTNGVFSPEITSGGYLVFGASFSPRVQIGNKGIVSKDMSTNETTIKLWSDILAPNDTAITTEELNEVLV
jgi:hypothetical protein